MKIEHVFSPMYVMCPLRRQVGDAGVADWVKHAIKFAWLRMHKDFLLQPPKRHSGPGCSGVWNRVQQEMLNAVINSPEYHAAKTKRDALETRDRRSRTAPSSSIPNGTQNPRPCGRNCTTATATRAIPYNACQDVAAFRRKYGMVVLLDASNQGARSRTCARALQNDMDAWTMEQELKEFRDATVTSRRSAGRQEGRARPEVTKDGRLLSVFFDPAAVENRLHQYGDLASTWTVVERRQRNLEAYCPTSAEVDEFPTVPTPAWWIPVERGKPLEQQLLNGSWVPYGTRLGAGRMVPVAHGFRLEHNLQENDGQRPDVPPLANRVGAAQ